MLYGKTLVISRYNRLWLLSDSKGAVCCADSRDVLADMCAYAKIRKVRNISEIKDRFLDSVVFLR